MGERANYTAIYKAGDDLRSVLSKCRPHDLICRQDAVVMQLVSVMNNIWQSEGHDLRMKLFRCLPTGQKSGLIEMVAECRTFREIQAAQG